MFPVLRTEWEENFQDLSGFCVTPTSRNGQDQCAAMTDELNTPMIELEREEFHFNIDLSRSEPKFDSELENNWELPSPQDIVDPYSPTVIARTAAANTMGCEDSEFITFDDYDKKMNIFISDNHGEDFVLKSVGAAPLALVEGKLNKMDFHAANNGFAAETLNTPDIVRMLIEFPVKDEKLALEALKGVNPALRDLSPMPECLNQASTSADVMESHGYDFVPPLPEIIEEGFDLLSFIVDDCPKPKLPASTRQETTPVSGQQRGGKDLKKMLICSEPLTTIAIEDLQFAPSTSTDRAIMPASTSWIKEEACSDDSDDDEDEDDETYSPSKSAPKRKRSLARVAPPAESIHFLPAKRSRRATSALSTCSEVTTVSASSDSKYRELRDRNNEASKKSRQTRKSRDQDMLKECVQMEKVNRALKVRALEMETLVKRLRKELLTAVTKNKK